MKSSKVLTKLALKVRHNNLFPSQLSLNYKLDFVPQLPLAKTSFWHSKALHRIPKLCYAKTRFWQGKATLTKTSFWYPVRAKQTNKWAVNRLSTRKNTLFELPERRYKSLTRLKIWYNNAGARYKALLCNRLQSKRSLPCLRFVTIARHYIPIAKIAKTGIQIAIPAICNWSDNKSDNYIPKYCFKRNIASKYRVLTLRSSNILYRQRKKHKMIRPLLDFKRESITMICKDLQIPVYPDKSNRSVRYSRNRIRKQIIPSIKYFINPQVENSLFKVAQLLQKEQSFVYSLLKNTSRNTHL